MIFPAGDRPPAPPPQEQASFENAFKDNALERAGEDVFLALRRAGQPPPKSIMGPALPSVDRETVEELSCLAWRYMVEFGPSYNRKARVR